MASVSTVSCVLNKSSFHDRDFIQEILDREVEQGCSPKPGAYDRIKAALIEAVDREVKCTST